MATEKGEIESPEQGPVQYETPWKMLLVFVALFLGIVVYGFLD